MAKWKKKYVKEEGKKIINRWWENYYTQLINETQCYKWIQIYGSLILLFNLAFINFKRKILNK